MKKKTRKNGKENESHRNAGPFCNCKKSIDHIHRISGQLRKLENLLKEGGKCEEVAHLTLSLSKSFESLRVKTLQNLLFERILYRHPLTKQEKEKAEMLFRYIKR